MTIKDKIRDEKPQYDINREVAKTSTLSLGKIDEYEYLKGLYLISDEWLNAIRWSSLFLGIFVIKHCAEFNLIESRTMKQTKFTYSLLEKSFWKIDNNNWKSRWKAKKSTSIARKKTSWI